MNFSVYMVFHNEFEAAYKAIESALRTNPQADEVIIARDSADMNNVDFFDSFLPKILPRQDCMEIFYTRRKAIDPDKDLFSTSQSLAIINCYLSRLNKLGEISKNENILCLEPDSKVRGKITFANNLGIECLSVNKYDELLLNEIAILSGSRMPISGWGFCIGLTTRSALKDIYQWSQANQNVINDLLKIDQKLENIDHGLPIFAHLAGIGLKRTDQITEVNRNRFWKYNRKPLVHQYKKYYEI